MWYSTDKGALYKVMKTAAEPSHSESRDKSRGVEQHYAGFCGECWLEDAFRNIKSFNCSDVTSLSNGKQGSCIILLLLCHPTNSLNS